jgi:undecaprenyl-phosphate galactose phosphotransferase
MARLPRNHAAHLGIIGVPHRGDGVAVYPVAKRTFDIAMALLLLAGLFPVFLLISLLIKLTYRDVPVFVGIEVLGRGRRPFPMWKFSTMARDAHLMLDALTERDRSLADEWENSFKLKHDPRVLPGIGQLLRRTSLNELPQLYNVLRGEMSLVGPRPIRAHEEAFYLRFGGSDMLELRYSVPPGITGLWQISGRNDVSYAERVALDREYLRRRRFSQDVAILLRTCKKVLTASGAY